VINNTNSANDNKFQPVVFESREQSLIILRHGNDPLLELPTKNQ
jgi:hypothetical protein